MHALCQGQDLLLAHGSCGAAVLAGQHTVDDDTAAAPAASMAHMAATLGLPVALVVDAESTSNTHEVEVLLLQGFAGVRIAAVIFVNVSGPAQLEQLAAGVAAASPHTAVLGGVPQVR